MIQATFQFAQVRPTRVLTVGGDTVRLLGYTPEQFLSELISLQTLIHCHDQDLADRLFATQGVPETGAFNIRLRHADGRIRCTWCEYRRSSDGDKNPVIDITFIDAKSLYSSTNALHQMVNFEAMMANTDDYIYFKDRHHIFTGASQTLVAITNPSTQWQDLLGQTDYDVFSEAYADIYYRLEKQVFDGLPVARELQATLTSDGKRGWVDNRKYPIHDAAGNLVGLFGIARDVTDIKRVEQALRESESFLRTVIDEIPDPIVLKDAQANFLLCNRAVATLYNTTPDAMVGKQDGDFGVPAEMAEFFRQNVLSIIAQGETQTVLENSQDAVTGELRNYRSIKKPLKDANGNSQVLVVAQDVTDIVKTQKQLQESEYRLQMVMEITHEGIWDWHIPSGKVLHNGQWYRTLMFETHEIADTVEAFAALIHPEDQDAVNKQLDDLLHGVTDMYRSEHRLLRKDQTAIWVQDRGRVVERDPQGKAIRVIGSFKDISIQKAHQHHLEHIAHYDALTGLPNRTLLADRMRQAMAQATRRGSQMVVAYLDLDGFKAINDQHGHDAGDRFLTTVAANLKNTLREGDTIARLGGDEFVAVFGDLPNVQSGIPLIHRLLEVAARPTPVGALTLQVSASIGVSTFPRSDDADADADQLLRQADQAMYKAKLAGKNRYQLFDRE